MNKTITHVSGGLYISNNEAHKSLPSEYSQHKLKISGELLIENCSHFERLPDKLRVDLSAFFVSLPSLTSIWEEISVGKGLWFQKIHNLSTVPKPIGSVESLYVLDGRSVTAIADGIRVRNNATFQCPMLTQFPKDICVGGQVDLRGCYALRDLGGLRDHQNLFWSTVKVPARILIEPETITLQEIFEQRDEQLMGVMIVRYGIERFLLNTQAKIAASDEKGTLYSLLNGHILILARTVTGIYWDEDNRKQTKYETRFDWAHGDLSAFVRQELTEEKLNSLINSTSHRRSPDLSLGQTLGFSQLIV